MLLVPRIAAVSYLNTIPFIYGIQHADNPLRAELLLTPPATCAQNFMEGKADIALLPAAVVPELKGYELLPDYCLGAVGPVRTVMVTSPTPIGECRRLFLDPHSRTSVQLAGWLAANRWHIQPEWYTLEDYAQVHHAQPGDAFLLIGDKVFDYEGLYPYTYDLAEEWQAATHLPFAFAVWVVRKGTPYEVTDALTEALTFGVEHIYEAILHYGFDQKPYDAYDYLTRNIDFLFDHEKHKALQKFWDSGVKISPRVNPG